MTSADQTDVRLELTPAIFRRQGGARARRFRQGVWSALIAGGFLAAAAAMRGLPMALLAQLAATGFVWLLHRALRKGDRKSAEAWGLPRTVTYRLGPDALHADLGVGQVSVRWSEVDTEDYGGELSLVSSHPLLFLPRETGLDALALAPYLSRTPGEREPLPEGVYAGSHGPIDLDARLSRHWERQPMDVDALAVTWLGIAAGTATAVALPHLEGPVLAGACVLAYLGWRVRRATRPPKEPLETAGEVVLTEVEAIRRTDALTLRVPWSEVTHVEAYADLAILRAPLPIAFPAEVFGEAYDQAVAFAEAHAKPAEEPIRERARPDADNPFAAPDDEAEPLPSLRWGNALFWLGLLATVAFLALSR